MKRQPTASHKRHWSRIAELGCFVCGLPAEIHHVTAYADRMGRISRRHDCVVPLCPVHHRLSNFSVEALGHQGFYRIHGIDLYAEAERLWAESMANA